MPSRFHTMKCEASEDCTTSTAWMRLAYSWPMRWNTRSAPVRSTRTATPEYFASKVLATRSAAGRSSEVYQTTLPSFLAASIKAGVTELAGGAAALTEVACVEVANAPAAIAAEPFRMSRLESSGFLIVVSSVHCSRAVSHSIFALCCWLCREMQARAVAARRFIRSATGNRRAADRARPGSLRNVLDRRRDHAQLGVVGGRHHIVAA